MEREMEGRERGRGEREGVSLINPEKLSVPLTI